MQIVSMCRNCCLWYTQVLQYIHVLSIVVCKRNLKTTEIIPLNISPQIRQIMAIIIFIYFSNIFIELISWEPLGFCLQYFTAVAIITASWQLQSHAVRVLLNLSQVLWRLLQSRKIMLFGENLMIKLKMVNRRNLNISFHNLYFSLSRMLRVGNQNVCKFLWNMFFSYFYQMAPWADKILSTISTCCCNLVTEGLISATSSVGCEITWYFDTHTSLWSVDTIAINTSS